MPLLRQRLLSVSHSALMVKGNKYTHALVNNEVSCFAIINSLSTEVREAGAVKQLFIATSAVLTRLQVKHTLVLFQLLLTYAPYLNLQPWKESKSHGA